MVKLMQKEYEKFSDAAWVALMSDKEDFEFEGENNFCGYLLKVLEKAGMSPPQRQAQANDWANVDQEFLDEHEFTEQSWEPEDIYLAEVAEQSKVARKLME